MRVISGTVRGRRLKEPKAASGANLRPTSGKVKESIFNIIQFDIEGRQVLDLYAGTGQLGIEALSRGAMHVTFVDSSNDASRLIRENISICGFSERASVYTADAIRFIEYKEKFDIAFIDPPYDSPLASETLQSIVQFDKMNVNGIIICEMRAGNSLPAIMPPYRLEKEYKYGGVAILKIVRM